MMIPIPGLLGADQLAEVRRLIDAADWVDGNVTSGPQAALAKRNRQLPEDGDAARAAGAIILDALGRSALFIAAALPAKVFPPLFNRYGAGDGFGAHVDNAVRLKRGSDFRMRSDLSATLFLTDPQDYDGGDLTVDTAFGAQTARLVAGDLILYPASSVHHVTRVTRGERVASFFWVQSMVRDDAARSDLLELDRAIQALSATLGAGNAEVIRLTGVYHNLLRRWVEL
ncbi:Fe2+-dependent dioxygenase [Sphingomonas sp. 1P06PA]|uniref:Fe2+-dependent dioxygenase n=1 Tax=Sphingomonas sp. 1P06PA TaxID=554121 RepID=UPI0039A5BAB6